MKVTLLGPLWVTPKRKIATTVVENIRKKRLRNRPTLEEVQKQLRLLLV